MNRFQQQLDIAMQAINEMQDEFRFVVLDNERMTRELKRLHFAHVVGVLPAYDPAPPVHSCVRLDCIAEDIRAQPRPVVYFDVVNWLWTGIVNVRV